MIHRLCAGYFNAEDVVSSRSLTITKSMASDTVARLLRERGFEGDGQSFRVGKDILTNENGYVDCPWLTMGVNREAVEFMLRLNKETGCIFVDLGHGEIVGTDVLRESLGG